MITSNIRFETYLDQHGMINLTNIISSTGIGYLTYNAYPKDNKFHISFVTDNPIKTKQILDSICIKYFFHNVIVVQTSNIPGSLNTIFKLISPYVYIKYVANTADAEIVLETSNDRLATTILSNKFSI